MSGVEYPSQYVSEITIDDSQRVLIRPIQKTDALICADFFGNLSEEAKYLRFHDCRYCVDRQEVTRYCSIDHRDNFAFVAEIEKGKEKTFIAHGQYYRLPDGHSAEIAIVVEDAYQGKGIGAKLMEALARAAHDNGITTFEADVLAKNTKAMAFTRHFNRSVRSDLEPGFFHVTFPTDKLIK